MGVEHSVLSKHDLSEPLRSASHSTKMSVSNNFALRLLRTKNVSDNGLITAEFIRCFVPCLQSANVQRTKLCPRSYDCPRFDPPLAKSHLVVLGALEQSVCVGTVKTIRKL